MNNSYQILITKLDAFIRKYYKNRLLRGVIYAFTFLLASYLVVTTLEYFGHFDTTLRTVLFYMFLMVMIAILGRYVISPLMHLYRFGKIISHEQAAEIIGKHFNNVQDKLLNVLQLKRQSDENHDASLQTLYEAGIDQKIGELNPVPFVSAINLSENKKYLRYALLPLGAFIIILFTAPSLIKDSTSRLIRHGTYFEKPAPFTFDVLNKELKTVQQQDFQLDVNISGNEIPVEIYIELDGNQFKLDKDNLTSFHYLFRNIQSTQKFRLFADGYYSAEYTLEALPNPVLTNFNISLEYPAYVKKQNETLQNTGDLLIPAGTKVAWSFSTQNTENIKIVFHDTLISLNQSSENNFKFTKRFLRNDSYTVNTSNHFLNSKDSLHYSISVIPDLYPTISIEQQKDSLSTKRTFFKGFVKDDYGFTELSFNYRFLKSNDTIEDKKGKLYTNSLPVSRTLTADQFFYSWDASTINVLAGDEIEYYFQITDNDGINGPKSVRSQTQVFKAPTLKEIAENTNRNNDDIKSDLKESIDQAKQMQKDLNELSRKMLEKKEMTWEDKKKAEDLLNKQKELQQKLDEIRKKNEQKNKQEEEYKKINEDILDKQQQLQTLMDKLQSPELQKLMEQLQKLMENADKNKMQEQLSEMKVDNKDLQKELERTIELFKQMEFEQKLQENIDKLDELAKKQDDLSKKSADEKNNASEELKKEQDELNKDFEEFRKEQDELAKKNEELEDKKTLENTDQQEQDIEKDMEKSSDQLDQKKNNKASKSQKDAADKMQQLAEKMKKMQSDMEEEENEEDMDALRALLENLLHLSFDQESVMQSLKSIDINNPQYLNLSQQQRKLKDDSKMIEDSLFALSKRVMQIQSKVNQEISAINLNMDEALTDLESRSVPQARSRQQFAMTSINNLTLMLSESLKQMQEQQASSASGSCKKPGKKKSSSLAQIRKMQEELNKNMKKAKEGMKPGENKGRAGSKSGSMSEQLAKMAAQQEFIRNELNKLNSEENKDGKNSLGNLEDIARQMEQTEKDIVNRMISDETIRRQQNITTRLLESEKAERERDQDEQRKSEEAKNAFNRNLDGFEEYKRIKLKEMELLKTVPPSLNTYYRQKVNDYFQSIDK